MILNQSYMTKYPKWLALFCSLLFTAACSQPKLIDSHGHTAPGHTAKVIKTARSLLGVRYRYGGISPKTGFDCSGLVYYTHDQVGYRLPRTTTGQYRATRPVSRQALQPGDLVFFRIKRHKISHVGIYVGNNRFIHAPSTGKRVSITSLKHPYWQKRFSRGGRVAY